MTERAKYWADQLSAWEQSGLSQAAFCRERGLSSGSFAWWKRQLHKPDGHGPTRRGRSTKRSEQFVEVRLADTSSRLPYEIVLAGGRSIRISSRFDPEVLSHLIQVVESC
jgi:hypothetical protein